MTELFDLNHIYLNQNLSSRQEVLEFISGKAKILMLGKNKDLIFNAFEARENQSSTGMQNGIAMPHAISKDIQYSGVIYVSLIKPLSDWPTFDDSHVDKVIALLAPKNEVKEHLEILSEFASSLIDENKRKALDKCQDKEKVLKILKLEEE
ncbi:PTS sugar transporter subunit IIA [Liquorilactobacillus sicerae]|uniref:PTS sugar transporter subunit IIA n=1 Tax=Liquorilactobacillus sicerae TaxID=1416943 RepID=UPI002480E052|nr:PTS sugar transporter subunit IIA [Liquorilactobacillus sicerae]